jgi:hypothetical protein
MTKPRKSFKFRKPIHNRNAMQISVCGHKVDKKYDLICTLPPNHRTKSHATVAISEDDTIIFAHLEGNHNPNNPNNPNNEEAQLWEVPPIPEQHTTPSGS